MWRLTYAVPMWVAYLILTLPLDLLGLPIVALAILFRRNDTSVLGQPIISAPIWLALWGNSEDGYAPQWYTDATPTWPWWWRMWVWAAVRNRTNNLRFWKALHPPPVPERIQWLWIQDGKGYLCWQGIFTRGKFYTPWNGKTLTIGWRYTPADCVGVPSSDWRLHGCGFGWRYRVMAPGDV